MEITYIDIDVHRLLMDNVAEEQRIREQMRCQEKEREENTNEQMNNISYKVKNGKLYKIRPPPGIELLLAQTRARTQQKRRTSK